MKEKTKHMHFTGQPLEHANSIDDVVKHAKISKASFMRFLLEDFFKRVRTYQAQIDRCEPLRLDHDLAKVSALCIHLWDDAPMKAFLENEKKPIEKRTIWTWEPEVVTPAKKSKGGK